MKNFIVNSYYPNNSIDENSIKLALQKANQIIDVFHNNKGYKGLAELIGIGNDAAGKVYSILNTPFCLKISRLGKHVGNNQALQFELQEKCIDAIKEKGIEIEGVMYSLHCIPSVAVAVDEAFAYTLMIRLDNTLRLWDEENIPFKDKDNWPVVDDIKRIFLDYDDYEFLERMDVNGNNILVNIQEKILYLIDPYVPDESEFIATKVGNIYWIQIESDYKHPHVIINLDINTATVVAITTNQKKANLPGNTILDAGEGGLEKPSIVDVAKVYEVSLDELNEYIGSLEETRIEEIKQGIKFLKKSFLRDS